MSFTSRGFCVECNRKCNECASIVSAARGRLLHGFTPHHSPRDSWFGPPLGPPWLPKILGRPIHEFEPTSELTMKYDQVCYFIGNGVDGLSSWKCKRICQRPSPPILRFDVKLKVAFGSFYCLKQNLFTFWFLPLLFMHLNIDSDQSVDMVAPPLPSEPFVPRRLRHRRCRNRRSVK